MAPHPVYELANVFTSMAFKWFEPRGISYLFGEVVQVRLVFRKTVVGD